MLQWNISYSLESERDIREEYWEIGNQWRRLMREIVYSRCSETRILATAGILIRCERRETTTPIHWFYHLCLSRSHPIQLGNVFSGDQNRLPSEIWISQSRNFLDPENIWIFEMSVELGQTVPPNLDSRPLDLNPASFVCSDMLGTQPEESHLSWVSFDQYAIFVFN